MTASRPAELMLTGWHGFSKQPVEVIGETPKRYRIRAEKLTRLAGRHRYLEPGKTALVPKTASNLIHPDYAGGPMTTPSIAEIIVQLEACKAKDWRLDDLVNNTLGQVRAVTCIGLNGAGRRTRYFGPKADHKGRGSSVPSPTKSPESRQRAIKALLRHLEPQSENATVAMTNAEKAAFNNGYLLACCNLANMHDRPCLAADVLAEAGITEADVKAMDLSEYDAGALEKIRNARRDDPLS